MPEAIAPVADAEAIRTTAKQVLADPDYKLESTDTFARVWEWIRDFLRPVIDFFDALYDISPILFFGIVVVLVVIVLALLFHIFYSFRAAMQRRAKSALYEEIEDPKGAMPETWEQRARQAFDAEEYLYAIRFILHASLLLLEQARKSNLRRGSTNREYLRRFQKTAAFAPLSQIVEITDSRWFGGVECSRSDVETCFRAHQQIQGVISGGNANADSP